MYQALVIMESVVILVGQMAGWTGKFDLQFLFQYSMT